MEPGKTWPPTSSSVSQKVLPPRWFLLALVLMVALHFGVPITGVLPYPWIFLGLPLIIFGITIELVADRSFKKHRTTVKPFQESTALVTEGVFGFCRHPMYSGFVLILLGIAMLLGTLSPFFVIPMFVFLMEKAYIAVEEKMMAEKFGEAWSNYAGRVRKWI